MQKILCSVLLLAVFLGKPVLAGESVLTILHTNDLHSHLLGFPPNIDYTPEPTGDDKTIGGWARIAAVIKNIREERENPVLVLDAGDFLMGSLFHLLSREESFELRLLSMMGYDVAALGNHEFDLRPEGLARILRAADSHGRIPPIVCSNIIFSDESPSDDALEAVFREGLVKRYLVLEKSGIKIGIFGLMGKDAAEVAPFAAPVRFADPIKAAEKTVRRLWEEEDVDMVICLSHCGLWEDKERSEDEILAAEVPGINIIVSGHTHTETERPRRVGETLIVQAGSYGKRLGVLEVSYGDGRTRLKNYRLLDIDDHQPADQAVSASIRRFEGLVDQHVLIEKGLSFRKPIARTDFELSIDTEESNLGNLLADAIRWSANQYVYEAADPVSRVKVGIISNGVIRDAIVEGKSGKVAVCDLFRAVPLGIGMDGTMGYPLVTFYVYPAELKKGLEILTSIYPLKGSDYYLQTSGVRFAYNPHRMLFDRITDIRLGSEEDGYQPLDYANSNKQLIRVTADIYNSTFLKIVGDFTWHILDIVPKDRSGKPIGELGKALVDSDANQPGVQELKEWTAVVEYIRNLPDTAGDGLPNIPDKYRGKLGRQLVEAGWNPYHLLRGGNYLTWSACAAIIIVLTVLFLVVRYAIRKFRAR